MTLTSADYKTLTELAVLSIKHGFRHHAAAFFPPDQFNDALRKPSRSYVSLKTMKNEFMGCQGNLTPEPLFYAVIKNAFYSAYYDHRYPPLNKYRARNSTLQVYHLYEVNEYKNLKVEEIEQLIQKDHSIEISVDNQRALMLSSMQDYFGNKRKFIDETYHKAGIKNVPYDKVTVRLHKTIFTEPVQIGELE